jgi:addiction module RelE/StbE family toxin
MIVEWRPEAEADRDDIVAYIEGDNPYAARRILQELIVAADSLYDFPYRGRPGLVVGTRELDVVGPYVLLYEIDPFADKVLIWRVWHSAQDRSKP